MLKEKDTGTYNTIFNQAEMPLTAGGEHKKYYAHSLKDAPVDKWQPLDEHLAATAKTASEFAAVFNSFDWGYIAGLLHDFGKYSDAFQQYLLEANGINGHIESRSKVDHSTAGAQMAANKLKDAGKLLAYIIAGHHSGLPDSDKLRERLLKKTDPTPWVSELLQFEMPSLPFVLDNPTFSLAP